MNRSNDVRIRPLTPEDIAHLSEIDANFKSYIFMDVVKEVNGLGVCWRLIERPFIEPFVSTDYNFDEKERREIHRRLKSGQGLWLVAETAKPRRLVGLLDVGRETWREAAWVWNIAVDQDYRGQGLGRELMERAIAWGKDQGLRAVILETQTNNWPACRFYRHFGFQLTGIDDHYYTNQDVANKEVALFWAYEL